MIGSQGKIQKYYQAIVFKGNNLKGFIASPGIVRQSDIEPVAL